MGLLNLLGLGNKIQYRGTGENVYSDRDMMMNAVGKLMRGELGGAGQWDQIIGQTLGDSVKATSNLSQTISRAMSARGLSGSRAAAAAEGAGLNKTLSDALARVSNIDVARYQDRQKQGMAGIQLMDSIFGKDMNMDQFNRNMQLDVAKSQFGAKMQALNFLKDTATGIAGFGAGGAGAGAAASAGGGGLTGMLSNVGSAFSSYFTKAAGGQGATQSGLSFSPIPMFQGGQAGGYQAPGFTFGTGNSDLSGFLSALLSRFQTNPLGG